jgi:hypothetical protein
MSTFTTQSSQTSTPSTVTTANFQFVGPDVMVASSTGNIGFFGTTPVLKPTGVTDLATLLTALTALGLISA